jgi:predicted phage terminase large subunit-like protein
MRFTKRELEMVLRTDLVSFNEKVVRTIDPGCDYLDNWHAWAIAWHLEQVRLGKIRRLIICAPPRSGKSIMASVAWPAFLLGHDPSCKIMHITYSQLLAAKLANDFRATINALWYGDVFPHTRISKDSEDETVFTACGFRFATSTGGNITGRGADVIIADDLSKAQDIFSDVRREATNELFRNTILSRLDNKQTGAIVVVMQRLHPHDFVGHLLDNSDEWVVLNLPAIAITDERIPIGDNRYHFRAKGEALHPAREPLSILKAVEREVGPYAWASQFLQDPMPIEGNMILRLWLRYHNLVSPTPSYNNRIIQSWDTAGKLGPRNSYSVCTTWLVSEGSYYLLDVVRGRFDFSTLESTAIEVAKKWKPSVILIEDASSGTYLAERLKKAGVYQVKLQPVSLDKVTRLYNQAAKFAAGRVFLSEHAPWRGLVEKELLGFPKGQINDIVDSISQALAYQGSSYTLAYVS